MSIKKATNVLFILMITILFTVLYTGQASADENAVSLKVYRDFFGKRNVDYTQVSTLFKGDNTLTAAFIAQRTGKSPTEINIAFLRYNNSWFDVMVHYNIQPTDLFIPVPPDYKVGPPYGNAYGYWENHKKNPKHTIKLSNQDIMNLVHLNILHQHFGTPVLELMSSRQAGHSFDMITSKEYEKAMRKLQKQQGKGQSKGQGKEKDKDNK
jgi:hypothetical protein